MRGVRASTRSTGGRNAAGGIRAQTTVNTGPKSSKVPNGAGGKWLRIKPDRWLRSGKETRFE